jgi:hypothetical protein
VACMGETNTDNVLMRKPAINTLWKRHKIRRNDNIKMDLKETRKCTAIPVQAWTGPQSTRRLRLPYFKKIGT